MLFICEECKKMFWTKERSPCCNLNQWVCSNCMPPVTVEIAHEIITEIANNNNITWTATANSVFDVLKEIDSHLRKGDAIILPSGSTFRKE